MRILFAGMFLLSGCFAWAQDESTSQEEAEEISALRVRHAEILGKVLIASQEEGTARVAGSDVVVEIGDIETGETLVQTVTDEEGDYVLPRLDVGRYFLHIGKLRLNMFIVPESEMMPELPKVIVVIIPEEMAR